jgi:small subunit ribosomal protein S1
MKGNGQQEPDGQGHALWRDGQFHVAGRWAAVNDIVLSRTHQPEKGVVFMGMPYGTKPLNGVDGPTCDFDRVYSILEATMRAEGMRPERLDGLYGPTAMIDLISRSIQRAEVVVVDFTTKNHNVTFELAIALMFGKKIVMISQDIDHVPSDYRGQRILTYSQMYDPMEALKESLVAQINALLSEPSSEQTLGPLPSIGRVVSAPATVMQVEREYAVVRMDDPTRPPAVLSNADVDRTRLIPDMARRFKVGDRVEGAFVVDTIKGSVTYTLVAGQEDPWPALEKQFPVGKIFTGVVRTVLANVGPFVTVDGDVNGLIPERTLPGPIPPAGSQVEVKVAKIDRASRRISLRLNRVVTAVTDAGDAQPANPLVGQHGYGRVVKAVPFKDGRGGFILLEIRGRERPAMLLCKDMTDELREDLNNGQVGVGEEIYVEVAHVDEGQDRVYLRELPEPQDESDTAVSAHQPAA